MLGGCSLKRISSCSSRISTRNNLTRWSTLTTIALDHPRPLQTSKSSSTTTSSSMNKNSMEYFISKIQDLNPTTNHHHHQHIMNNNGSNTWKNYNFYGDLGSSSTTNTSSSSSSSFSKSNKKKKRGKNLSLSALNCNDSLLFDPFGPKACTEKFSSFEENFDKAEMIGSGRFGVVRLCRDRRSLREYAAKSLKKDDRDERILELRNEILALKRLNHPNVLRLVKTHEDRANIHIITELCTGGSLFDLILQSNGKGIPEPTAAKYMAQILKAVEYCHSQGVAHLDIKPQNILFASKPRNDDSRLVLVDFGLSAFFDPNNVSSRPCFHKRCGSPMYVSPEVISQAYNHKADLWSVGVILFNLLVGKCPFHGKDADATMARVLRGTYVMEGPVWDGISQEAKDLVRSLLVEPSKRLSATEALQSSWIRKNNNSISSI